MYSYRDGYLEGVVFVLYKDGKILIEHRPIKDGEEVFITSGKIDEKDKEGIEDYKITAMRREADEEMSLKIINFEYITEYKVEKLKLWLYAYVVLEWEGDVPAYTTEYGKDYARTEWIDLEDYDKKLQFLSSKFICEKLIEKLRQKIETG